MCEEYLVLDPKIPIAGCLAVVATKDQYSLIRELEKKRQKLRYTAKAILSDHIPLSGSIPEIINRKAYHLLKIKEDPLSIYLHYGGKNAIYYDLCPGENGYLKNIQVDIETNLPSKTFGPARTAINELIDAIARTYQLPLVLMRIDIFIKGEKSPLAHQLLLPYPSILEIGPLGGIHLYPAFATYNAVLREAITSTSPYYRFLCAYRLYEGLNKLRHWMRKTAKALNVVEKLPKDPQVDKEFLKDIGFDVNSISTLNKIGDLWKKYTEPRNRIAHFFLKKDDRPLNFSHGQTYNEYSIASGILLYHSNLAFVDLVMFFNKYLNSKLAMGSILPMKEQKENFCIKLE